MRKVYLLFILFSISYTVPAQYIYYSSLDNIIADTCFINSSPSIQMRPQGWLIYQTTNGNWDGPIDSSRCISAQQQGFGPTTISLAQINPAEPLFVRVTDEELAANQVYFAPNKLFNLRVCANLGNMPVPEWHTGSNCEQDVCTGAFLGIVIPDSNGLAGGATRYHTSQAGSPENPCFVSCFPSEYFADQTLRTLVLKFSFDSLAAVSNQFLNLSSVAIEEVYDTPGLITEVLAGDQYLANGVYTMNVYDAANNFPFNPDFLALYNPVAYPDPQHESYIEGRPVPNTSDPQIINLVVEEYQTLEIQPFTNFRGAKVLGSDSIRHTLNLVNNGGDLCMNYVDVIFSGNDEYQHAGGTISMQNGFSCMQFHDESALRVKAGATLHYGRDGTGLLLLCAGSTIVLEPDATLYFDGRLMLSECDENLPSQQIYMDLPPGARLIFTDQAQVSNQFSVNQQMKLQVRMLGGTLDDSALSPESRAAIQRVWPSPAPRLADNISISPNPYSSGLTLDYLSAVEENIRLVWTNLNGQIIGNEQLHALPGKNSWQPIVPEVAGIYLLTFEGKGDRCTQKVVKIAP